MRRLLLLAVVILLLAAQRASAADPGIDSISPAVLASSPSPQTVTIAGHDFAPGAVVTLFYSRGSNTSTVDSYIHSSIVHDVTVVSSSKITMTVQYQPTATLNLIVSVSNAPDSASARAALTITAGLSDATPIIFTVDQIDFDHATTTVQARVTPHSTAYLVFSGHVPHAFFGIIIGGVKAASDDDGDGIVTFPEFDYEPGLAVFFVIDSMGVRHWAEAPWSTSLPDANMHDVNVELGPDGALSRIVVDGANGGTFPLLLWVRPGVGAWWASPHDGGQDDVDVPSTANGHVNLMTSAFRILGTSPPPPQSFQSSDDLVVMNGATDSWWSSVLPAPLTGTARDGTIYATSLGSREGTPGILYLERRGGAEGPISVDYRTSNGTAMSDVNYVPSSGTVMFARGEFLKSVSIDTRRDGTYTNALSYNVELTPHGTSVDAGNTFQMFVSNVDALPAISIADVRIAEGDSGIRTVNVPVTLVGATTLPAIVYWYASDGTQGGLQFAPGETSKSIAVTYSANTDPGPDRKITITIALQFSTPATIANATGVVTIVDDDTQALSVSDVRAEEQSQTANFLVTMSRAVNAPVTVHYATVDGTATAPLDYAAASGILTFTPGEIAKTVTVAVVQDRVVDPDETFTLRLSDAAGATINKSTGTATILESDRLPQPVVLIDDITVAEGNSGTTDATFNVRLSFASALPVIVAWRTENGSARDDSDYAAGIGTLTFAPGETVLPVTVKISGDTTPEPNETFGIVIIGASNAIPGTGGTCTIINDDGQPPPPRHRPSHS
jgi:hypothetical protein